MAVLEGVVMTREELDEYRARRDALDFLFTPDFASLFVSWIFRCRR